MNILRKSFYIILLLILSACITIYAQNSVSFENPPDLIKYIFKSRTGKILPGKSTEKAKGFGCTGNIYDDDSIGSLAVVTQFYQNGCYTDGKYNNKDYKVEQGTVTDEKSAIEFDAYRIHEPAHKASKFMASQHTIYYKFPQKEDYSVYSFDGEKLSKVADIRESEIKINDFVQVKGVIISDIKGERTYLFAPSSKKLSGFTTLGKGIEGARLKDTGGVQVYKYRFDIKGTPPDNKTDFNYGPGSWSSVYSPTRKCFIIKNRNQIGAVWQDVKRKSINLTWIDEERASYKNMTLENGQRDKLAAAAYDDSGSIYYLTVEDIKSQNNSDIRVIIHKADATGREIKQRRLSTMKSEMNMVSFGNYVASMSCLGNKIGIIIARTMHRSSDGLNHQGAIALVIDAGTLGIIKNWGQTSGHSFDSILVNNSRNEFAGIDLGDNYPRGVHLHKFTDAYKYSRIVYTFKTSHGTKAASPAGRSYQLYSEISGSGRTYYKWSNDNKTYTELGGIIEGSKGYTIIFAGEPDSSGRALNNERVGNNLNDPRNIGLVRIIPDFEKASGRGCEVSDDMVLSKGINETGGFYTFGGSWSKQRNTGVRWLTEYKNKEEANASRVKAVKLSEDKILLLWEKWTPDNYITTLAMLVDETGDKLQGPVDLGSHVRLHRRDDPFCVGSKVYIFTGDEAEGTLEMIVFKVK